MEPKLISLPDMRLVGLGAKFISGLSPNSNNKTVIGDLWFQYGKRMPDILNRTDPRTAWGVIEMLPKDQQPANPLPNEHHLYYLAAAEVTAPAPLPAGFEH